MTEYIVPSNYNGKLIAAEKLIRCKDCVSWKTPLAFTATGKCAHPDHKGQITNRNFYCGDGREKDG